MKNFQFQLNNGKAIPLLGFGTWQLKGDECTQAVETALATGYRHIDTAAAYGNHLQVAEAIKKSRISREEIFLTSKVWRDDLAHDDVLNACETALTELQTGYLDLYLVHWPNKLIPLQETFSALEELKQQGKIRAYGVSNFTIHHLQDVLEAKYSPSCNQVEFHPSLNQNSLKEFCDEQQILLTAYSPIAQGQDLKIDTVKTIASVHNAQPSQVILAWLLAKNICAIPRSADPEHIKSNWESQNIELTKTEIDKLNNLNADVRIVNPNFSEFDY